MRFSRLAIVVALAAALVGTVSAGAGAHSTTHWIRFYVHMNAYAHWGVGCSVPGKGDEAAEWDSPTGVCYGSMEEGSFLNHHFAHSSKVSWTWNSHGGLTVAGHGWRLVGLKPHNWYTFTVHEGYIDGAEYVTGTTGAAGHPDGPLYVDLTSKLFYSGIQRQQGQVLDLQGYLRAK